MFRNRFAIVAATIVLVLGGFAGTAEARGKLRHVSIRPEPQAGRLEIYLPRATARKLSRILDDNVNEDAIARLLSGAIIITNGLVKRAHPSSDLVRLAAIALVENARYNTKLFKRRLKENLGTKGVLITVVTPPGVFVWLRSSDVFSLSSFRPVFYRSSWTTKWSIRAIDRRRDLW